MTPGITTVPAVEAKLEELLKAAVEASTEVWAGRPAEDHQANENVYLGEVRGSREWHSMPALTSRARAESYEVTVIVEVIWQGTDLVGARTRLWELAQQVEGAVAANPTLGDLPQVKSALSGRFSRPQFQSTIEEVLGQYQFGVQVTARL